MTRTGDRFRFHGEGEVIVATIKREFLTTIARQIFELPFRVLKVFLDI